MKHTNLVRSLVLFAALVAGSSAFAQISFNIIVAPPAPRYEVVPVMQPGYVWAPGYWAWNNDQHIWVRGRTIVQREGYNWTPDHWVQQSGSYVRQPGHWEHSQYVQPVKVKKQKHNNGKRNHGNSGK